MKKTKRILTLTAMAVVIGVAALLATVNQAQATDTIYAAQTLISSPGTYTNAAGSAATNYAAVIDCRKQAKVTVQITQTYDGAGTGACIYYFQRSVDGVNYDYTSATMNGQAVGLAGTGNTPVTIQTNLDTLGCGYMRLAWVTNASAASVNLTNLTVKYAVKIQAP